jgi:hypothetical protein
MAAHNQESSANYFKNKILKEGIESKFRLCKQHEETTDHLTSGCPILAKNEYFMRQIMFVKIYMNHYAVH